MSQANTIKITTGQRVYVVDYDGKTWQETNLMAAIRSAVEAGSEFDFQLVLDKAAAAEIGRGGCG